jgi:archaellin
VYQYTFIIACASEGEPDLDRVENLIDLNMQDLVYDENFITALDESQAVTIQVIPQIGRENG